MTLRFCGHHKLKNATDFSSVFNEATCKQYGGSILLLAKPSGAPVNRLGMIVAKRYIRRAVDRNKIKRVMREAFRKQSTFPVTTRLDIVLLVRGGVSQGEAGYLYKKLELLLDKLLRKANETSKRRVNAYPSY